MQLVAYGAQDIYLTGNPQITFFKVVYRRHTNFSMETISQTLAGSNTCTGSSTVTISRNGDLVNKVYVNLSGAGQADLRGAYASIKEVELEIGGQRIDCHSGQWMTTYTELTHSATKIMGLQLMCDRELYTTTNINSSIDYLDDGAKCGVVQLPLQFWFCRNPGLALPLIALQYHEVKLKFQWLGLHDGSDPSGTSVPSTAQPRVDVLCDYIYLDTDERRRFAQVSHEYLIEQVQTQKEDIKSGKNNVLLNFNHPVKELIWIMGNSSDEVNEILRTSNTSSDNPVSSDKIKLQLNGHDRFSEQSHEYFTKRQVYDYHSGLPFLAIGGLGFPGNSEGCWTNASKPYVYSFALKPEEHQPSGTCNFSRIDNAKLIIDHKGASTDSKIKIFAVNYNVLRIMSGMGGLAYSN